MRSSDAPHTDMWPEGWGTSVMADTLGDLYNSSNNSSAGEEETPQDLPEWLVRLDQAATLLMTFNTITLMLGMGAATYWKEFWEHLKRPWACLIGLACQFVLLPALGFGLCLAFRLPPYEALGVLILACSPGGAFSNFFTYWVNGDLALSIMMTALSSLLAFGVMPLNVWLYSSRWTDQELLVPYVNILISLVIVTVPVIFGMVVRHFSRKWASYLSKVCSALGWAGALTCGVLLILRYWDTIVRSSIYLVIIAAVTPLSGFLVTYILVKIVCFSHKICRTVAIETGCQNMVVATSIILLSFPEPQARGQMVLFPVLYGLCQLAEALVAAGLFQVWFFAHRDDVTEEEITSVVDTSLLTSIPVPAHKLSQMRMEQMADYSTVPNMRSGPAPPPQHTEIYGYRQCPSNEEWREPDGTKVFLPRRRSTHDSEIAWDETAPGTLHMTPNMFTTHDNGSTTDYPLGDSTDLDVYSDEVLESARSYDSDGPCSPSLSNKGVPNMFPVTENDFQSDFPSDQEDSPHPYGSPIPSYRGRLLDSAAVDRQGDSPRSASPKSPSPAPYERPFAFYHGDVRLGQTQQFSTFGRK